MTGAIAPSLRPRLWARTRLAVDRVRGKAVLLWPEGLAFLNESAAQILTRCDGRTVDELCSELSSTYGVDVRADVEALLRSLVKNELLTLEATDNRPRAATAPDRGAATAAPAPPVDPLPTTLLAELTYRCPLHCPYCSNPVEIRSAGSELSLDEWRRVLDEARELGVLQLGLSGGEPLVRRDVDRLVSHAVGLGMYVTLVTSGLGLTAERAAALGAAGIQHIQLSLQDANAEANDATAGLPSWEKKQAAAALIRDLDVAFSINVVLHRRNLPRLGEIITRAAEMGAERLELANTQYYGWALRNRAALMPSASQLADADRVVAAARTRHAGRMRILYVVPDYHETFPKPCMGGWGQRYIVVTPDGLALPCQAARSIESIPFESVREHSLERIWRESAAFNAFRGDRWMPDECRSCERRHLDFGGCRCQAFALTGSAANSDPVCIKSPNRATIERALMIGHDGAVPEWTYRSEPAVISPMS